MEDAYKSVMLLVGIVLTMAMTGLAGAMVEGAVHAARAGRWLTCAVSSVAAIAVVVAFARQVWCERDLIGWLFDD